MENYPIIHYPTEPLKTKDLMKFKGYRSGVSENYFEYKLHKYFNNHLKTGMVIDEGRTYPYQPDYIIYYSKYDLYIDVEIDEPYAYGSKKPIHYDDTKRNNYFLSRGWSIIRFAEEQICKYPDLCCKIITEHIRNITGENIWTDGFSDMDDIKDLKPWTKDEAVKMAKGDYRNEYINELQKIEYSQAQISILADGIYLNNEISSTKTLYRSIWPNKVFFEFAKISLLLDELLKYCSQFKTSANETEKIHVEFIIYISTYHSFYSYSFDTDLIYIGNYIVNIFYVRTDELICFKINDFIRREEKQNILLIADDPAYAPFLARRKKKNIVLMRNKPDTFMPLDLPYIDSSFPLGRAIGLDRGEL